jgi:hypothetical protein
LPTTTDFINIDLLVGSDHYNEFVLSNRLEIEPGLFCIDTSVGWIIQGRHPISTPCKITTSAFFTHTIMDSNSSNFLSKCDDPLTDKFIPSFLWDLETIGVTDKTDNENDEKALKMFTDSIMFENNRYQVTWPWKSQELHLAANYKLCLSRLAALVRRYKETPKVFEQYQAIIDCQVKEGIIKKSKMVYKRQLANTIYRITQF